MIYVVDDFLDTFLLESLQEDDTPFEEFDTGEKSFWVKYPSPEFVQYVGDKLVKIENRPIRNILSFFREARAGQDDSWRIHNDTIINGENPDRAIVLHIKSPQSKDLNGTAFWEHKDYGIRYELEDDKFDEVLRRDSEDLDKWTLRSVVGYRENRLISYPSNYFHSKYPNEFTDSRVVFVMFYKI
tara:strand:+ start:391 stop:945 length:555 start_codon:yes stop_codon:yes gene_type:complete